jgi:hypothetical protein
MKKNKLAPLRISEKCFPGCSKKKKSAVWEFRADYIDWKKFISAQRFGELEKSWCFKRFERNFFQDAWRHFGQFWTFILPRNIIKARNFQFCPKKLSTLEKILMLKPFQAVWKFLCCPIITTHHSRCSLTWKRVWWQE